MSRQVRCSVGGLHKLSGQFGPVPCRNINICSCKESCIFFLVFVELPLHRRHQSRRVVARLDISGNVKSDLQNSVYAESFGSSRDSSSIRSSAWAPKRSSPSEATISEVTVKLSERVSATISQAVSNENTSPLIPNINPETNETAINPNQKFRRLSAISPVSGLGEMTIREAVENG